MRPAGEGPLGVHSDGEVRLRPGPPGTGWGSGTLRVKDEPQSPGSQTVSVPGRLDSRHLVDVHPPPNPGSRVKDGQSPRERGWPEKKDR